MCGGSKHIHSYFQNFRPIVEYKSWGNRNLDYFVDGFIPKAWKISGHE